MSAHRTSEAIRTRIRELCANRDLAYTGIARLIHDEFGILLSREGVGRICRQIGLARPEVSHELRRKVARKVTPEIKAVLQKLCGNHSTTEIVNFIWNDFGVQISDPMVRRWCQALGIAPLKTRGQAIPAKVLKEIKKLCGSNLTYPEISAILTQKKLKYRGGPFTAFIVRSICTKEGFRSTKKYGIRRTLAGVLKKAEQSFSLTSQESADILHFFKDKPVPTQKEILKFIVELRGSDI